MSALIDSLVTQCATNISNPAKDRVTAPDWLTFYNAVARDIGARLYAVRYTSFFDLQNDSDYDYPDEMTRMIALWVTDTPSDPDLWRWVGEIREDQFRDRVNVRYPTAALPSEYLPEATIFRVVPKPTAKIALGGKLEYWGLPDEILSTTGTFIPFPDFLREWLVEGMTIHALRKLKQIAEANDRYASWERREADYAARLTDRSDDRRSALVPKVRGRAAREMV